MNSIKFIFLGSVLMSFSCAGMKAAKVASGQHPEAITCDPQYDAQQILAQKKSIPAEVFHFTRKEILAQDMTEHRLSEKSWMLSLVGGDLDSTNRQVRRGLYVSDGIDTNNLGNSIFGTKNNWLVQLTITDECRAPKKIATLLGLEKDARFISWFNKIALSERQGLDDLERFAKTCSARESLGLDGYTDLRCEKIVLRFFEENHIAVVQEHQASKNFYFRDFTCIEYLKGTPESLIQIFLSQDFWVASCSVEYLSDYTPYLLAHSLAENTNPVSKADYELLFQNVGLLRSESVRTEMAKMLKGYQQCVQEKKQKSFQKSVSALNLKLSDGDNFKWVSEDCSGE